MENRRQEPSTDIGPPFDSERTSAGLSSGEIRPSRTAGEHTTGRAQGNCFYCRQPGHWKRECPNRIRSINGTSIAKRGKETHVEMLIAGVKTVCLLDTGSEISLMPQRLLPDVELKPAPFTARAANFTEIPVVGVAEIAEPLPECHVRLVFG